MQNDSLFSARSSSSSFRPLRRGECADHHYLESPSTKDELLPPPSPTDTIASGYSTILRTFKSYPRLSTPSTSSSFTASSSGSESSQEYHRRDSLLNPWHDRRRPTVIKVNDVPHPAQRRNTRIIASLPHPNPTTLAGPTTTSSISRGPHPEARSLPTPTTEFCIAVFAYSDPDPAVLSFSENEVIEIISRHESGWWDGMAGGGWNGYGLGGFVRRGWVPSNYVRPLASRAGARDLVIHPAPDVQQTWTAL